MAEATLKDPFLDLFKFPILVVDMHNEARKAKAKGQDPESFMGEEVDVILCTAELPYWDFVCITDGWASTQEGFDLALSGKFECSMVTFRESGSHIVPWTREKFKEQFAKFVESIRQKVEKLPSKKKAKLEVPEELKKQDES